MTVPTEVDDGEWVHLRHCEGGYLLQHFGTGEQVLLRGAYKLAVQDGNALLVQYVAGGGVESTWACDCLSKALMASSRTPDGPQELLIVDQESKQSHWRASVAQESYASQVVRFECIDNQVVHLEAYVSDIPVCGRFVRWGLSRWIHYVRGAKHDGRWMTKSVEGFRSFVEKMRYDKDHIRNSRKSMHDSSVYHGKELDNIELQEYDPDWAVSTEGLVLMCLHFATSGKLGGGADCSDRAVSFMQAFFVVFLERGAVEIDITDEDDDSIGRLRCDRWQISRVGGAPMDTNLAALVRHVKPLADLLVDLAQTIKRPSQFAAARVEMSAILLHNLIDYIAATVELKRKETVFRSDDHLDMQELFREGSSRPRRVPKTLKVMVSHEAVAQPSLRNAQQLLAARKILFGRVRRTAGASKKHGGPKLLSAGTGRGFARDNMLSYMTSARNMLGQCRHGYVGMDGTKVSSQDIVFYVFEAVEAKKVVRGNRMRKTTVGAEATEEEKLAWRSLAVQASRKRKASTAATAEEQAKHVKRQARIPKLATWEWLMALDASLADTLGHGLEWYRPKVQDRPFDDDFDDGEKDMDNVLVFCMDEESKQLAGYYYLERKVGLNVVRHQPPLHRRHNDLVNTLVRSNLYDIVALTVMQRNISYGPWGKGGNLQELWESAMEMMSLLTPDDSFFMKMWTHICRDRQYQDEESTGYTARKKFLEELSSYRPFAVKGPRAAPSKWMSVINAIKYERPDHSIKLMGIAFLCLSRNWVDDLEALFCQKKLLSEQRDEAMQRRFGKAAAAGTATSAASSSGAASSRDATSANPTASRAAAKARANAKASNMIAKSQNALMAVGRLMANQEYKDLQEVLYVVCRRLQEEHVWAVQIFKKTEGVYEYYKDMALGKWLEPLWDAAETLVQWHRFKNIVGLTTTLPNSMLGKKDALDEQAKMERVFCETIWRLVANLLTERAGSCQYHVAHYPGVLAGLLGNEQEQVTTLNLFKRDWTSFCEARKSNSPEVQRLCDLSSLNTKVMQQTARIAKRTDWNMSGELHDRVKVIFGGLCQEDILEDSLGKVRDTEYRDASSRVLKRFKAFEVPVAQRQLERWGRDEVAIAPELPLAPTIGEGDTVFFARPRPEMDMKGVMNVGAQQDWQTFSTQTLRAVPGAMALLRHLHYERDGDFTAISSAWKAGVVPKHCVIVRRAAGVQTQAFFSLECTKYAVLGWPIRRMSDRLIVLRGRGHSPTWHVVLDLDMFYVLPMEVLSPLACFLDGVSFDKLGRLASHTLPVKVLEYQATHGFAGVSEESLRRLFVELEIDEPVADESIEVPHDIALAAELSLTVLPEMTDADLKLGLQERLYKEVEVVEGVMEDVLTDEATRDCLREQDRKAMQDFIGQKQASKANRMKHTVNVQKYAQKRAESKKGSRKKPKVQPSKVARGAAKASALTKSGALRWWSSVKGDMSFVNEWRPPRGSVTQDDANGRFLLSYPAKSRVSFSWFKRGMEEASVMTLKKLWEWHAESTGEECPIPV